MLTKIWFSGLNQRGNAPYPLIKDLARKLTRTGHVDAARLLLFESVIDAGHFQGVQGSGHIKPNARSAGRIA